MNVHQLRHVKFCLGIKKHPVKSTVLCLSNFSPFQNRFKMLSFTKYDDKGN